MTMEAAHDTIMPRGLHPSWEGDIARLLIVKDYAALCMKKEPARWNGTCGASLATEVTGLTRCHHRGSLPLVVGAWHVGIDGD